MSETSNCYAFYREANPSFAGERTYAGTSNGMERSFFGQGREALDKCMKMMAGARKNGRPYQVLRYEYRPFEDKARIHVMYSHGVPSGKKVKAKSRAD